MTDAIDYASDEFVAYQPGMMHVVTETKPTGDYRTAWLKVSVGGERTNWLALAESQAIEYVVAAITRTVRGLVSELDLNPGDGVPTDCVVNFDNIHTIPRSAFRRQITQLEPSRLRQACQTLRDATGC